MSDTVKHINIGIAAFVVILLLSGCQTATVTESNQPLSSTMQHIFSTADEPTSTMEGSEKSEVSSVMQSQTGPIQSSDMVSKKNVSSEKEKTPAVSAVKSKPPISSASMSSAKTEAEKPTESKPENPPAPKDPYAYPFDMNAIKADLIRYGEGLGMKHRTHYSDGTEVNPENGSYELPLMIDKDYPADMIKHRMYDQLEYYRTRYEAEVFTIYIIAHGNSMYEIYSIYA